MLADERKSSKENPCSYLDEISIINTFINKNKDDKVAKHKVNRDCLIDSINVQFQGNKGSRNWHNIKWYYGNINFCQY